MSNSTGSAGNPVLPGYYADPSIVALDGRWYVFATLDPWGGDTLGCWETEDFQCWTYRELNWPTKAACTSATSAGAMVWAPSVVRGVDGKFHMVVSVGSEIWAGLADHPLGPWRNALGDRPLIEKEFRPGFHMIDAEYFIDADGSAYLYWGSGHNWTNGRCWAVKLRPDMVTFDGDVKDVTPSNYFEAPLMFRHGGTYYLMYSQGVTIDTTYQVHYATGPTPFGPFTEASNSPILVTDVAAGVLSPGHHTVFVKDGQPYILYHRHSIPFDRQFIGRQLCIDRLDFEAGGRIAKVVPTHEGPEWLRRSPAHATVAARATASGQADDHSGPECVLDGNRSTRWVAEKGKGPAWLQLDLGEQKSIIRQEIVPEYAWRTYGVVLEASVDGDEWTAVGRRGGEVRRGSPWIFAEEISARYLRLTFPAAEDAPRPALFEWNVFDDRPSPADAAGGQGVARSRT